MVKRSSTCCDSRIPSADYRENARTEPRKAVCQNATFEAAAHANQRTSVATCDVSRRGKRMCGVTFCSACASDDGDLESPTERNLP